MAAEPRPRHLSTRALDSPIPAVLLAAAVATAVTLVIVAPRFTHTFPSMVDDWSAIERSLEQLPEALTGRNPEGVRYRPAWIVWNAVQWHTLGAPTHRWGPQLWGMLRIALLALGLSALAATIVWWPADRGGRLHFLRVSGLRPARRHDHPAASQSTSRAGGLRNRFRSGR